MCCSEPPRRRSASLNSSLSQATTAAFRVRRCRPAFKTLPPSKKQQVRVDPVSYATAPPTLLRQCMLHHPALLHRIQTPLPALATPVTTHAQPVFNTVHCGLQTALTHQMPDCYCRRLKVSSAYAWDARVGT
jgi:hypothetical protein